MTRSEPTLFLRRLRRVGGSSGRRLCAVLLALVLLQAQALGLWHRVAHAGLHAGIAPAAFAAAGPAGLALAEPAAPGDEPGSAGGRHGPFGHDADDERGCRLFDHLFGADALVSTPVAVGLQEAPPATVGPLPAGHAGRTPCHWQARAPPRA